MYTSISRRIDSTKKSAESMHIIHIYYTNVHKYVLPLCYPHVGNLACDVPEESSSYSVMISGLHTNPEGFKCRSWWYINIQIQIDPIWHPKRQRGPHTQQWYIQYINPIGFDIGIAWIIACFLLCMMILSLSPKVLAERHAKIMCLGEWRWNTEPSCKVGILTLAPNIPYKTLHPPEV